MTHQFGSFTAESWENGYFNLHQQDSASTFMPASPSQTQSKKSSIEATDHEGVDDVNAIVTSDTIITSPRTHYCHSRKRLCFGLEEEGQFEQQDIGPLAIDLDHMTSSSTIPSKDSREHSAEEWELHKPTIRRLYVAEKRRLREVIEAMHRECGFAAT
jgi:hypothetical protein